MILIPYLRYQKKKREWKRTGARCSIPIWKITGYQGIRQVQLAYHLIFSWIKICWRVVLLFTGECLIGQTKKKGIWSYGWRRESIRVSREKAYIFFAKIRST